MVNLVDILRKLCSEEAVNRQVGELDTQVVRTFKTLSHIITFWETDQADIGQNIDWGGSGIYSRFIEGIEKFLDGYKNSLRNPVNLHRRLVQSPYDWGRYVGSDVNENIGDMHMEDVDLSSIKDPVVRSYVVLGSQLSVLIPLLKAEISRLESKAHFDSYKVFCHALDQMKPGEIPEGLRTLLAPNNYGAFVKRFLTGQADDEFGRLRANPRGFDDFTKLGIAYLITGNINESRNWLSRARSRPDGLQPVVLNTFTHFDESFMAMQTAYEFVNASRKSYP